jgi:hypothetical protein
VTQRPPPSAEPAGNQASAPESIVGQWRGQTQFQGAEDGRELQEVHSVVPLVLTFSADGKVSGVSADNGCQLLGLWSPAVTPRLFTLDVTLSEDRVMSQMQHGGVVVFEHNLPHGCGNGSKGRFVRDPEGGPEARLRAAVVQRGQGEPHAGERHYTDVVTGPQAEQDGAATRPNGWPDGEYLVLYLVCRGM